MKSKPGKVKKWNEENKNKEQVNEQCYKENHRPKMASLKTNHEIWT